MAAKGRTKGTTIKVVGDLTPAPYNPRKIAEDADARLARSMGAFGDLSGVVFNRRSGQLIGGHQRVRHLPAKAPVTIQERLAKANAEGTVAVGYIEVAGERWVYREVDVDASTERAMNVAANKHGGEWDVPALADVLEGLVGEEYDMELTGFGAGELDELIGGEIGIVPLSGSDDGSTAELTTCPKCGFEFSAG